MKHRPSKEMDKIRVDATGSVSKILVVDDQRTNRLKLSLGVRALGHEAETAENGKEALDELRTGQYDLVLLDIVMPEMDGFEVLKVIKSDRALRDIPIIVISALDSEIDSVVKAIELGAEDFLPKNFDPVLLRARVNTCLEKKHHRDKEVEYLQQVERLTTAAIVLESGFYNPEKLRLGDMRHRKDALGRLAKVFTSMAQQVYERERRFRQQIRTLKGGGLLLAVGAIFGLSMPLSRMAAELEAHPLGIALYVNLICFGFCFASALTRGRLPKLNSESIKFFMVWGLISSILGQVFLFWAAQKLQASLISVIIVAEGFIVFAITTIAGTEQPSAKRFFGMSIGVVGVLIIVLSQDKISGVSGWHWVLIALGVPLGYALRDVYLAAKLPEDMDIVGAIGYSAAAGALIIGPLVFIFGDYIPLEAVVGKFGVLVLLLACNSAIGATLRVRLIRTAGAVFASQSSFVITFAGITWSMILLGEILPITSWGALGLMIVGLILVEPKHEAEEEPPLTISQPLESEAG